MEDVSLKRSSGTRAPYVSEACIVCRGRKTKCDGRKPICVTCEKSGRREECAWGKEPNARKPRTEAKMQKLIDDQHKYIAQLESIVDNCHRKHGGMSESESHYLQFRPNDSEEEEWQEDGSASGASVDPTGDLCIPFRRLKLEDRELLFHGNTAIYRFAPEIPPSPLPTSIRFPTISESPDECYVLLVEGVDESHYNPSFDWSRHLPIEVPQLDRRHHDKLLDLLFKFFTSWCLRIVPALFLRDMYRALKGPPSQPRPKTPHYSPMLHNALIALATGFSDNPTVRDLKSRLYFVNKAKSYIEEECHSPNLSVVHALSTISSFHSTQGDQTLGYMYFGMSARISQSLGLSIDCAGWARDGFISEDDRFDRNWAYWTTFSQDVCWSLYVGRDFGVPFPNQNIPIPFVDSDFDQMLWRDPRSGVSAHPSDLSKTFAASCELLRIGRRIMDVVNGLNRASHVIVVNNQLIRGIDLQLNEWDRETKTSLTSDLTTTPHRLMLQLAYWWFFILLHRPFYLRQTKPGPIHSSDGEIDHVKHCEHSAEKIFELINIWRRLYTLRYVPMTLIQTLFSAGTVYILMAVQATSGTQVADKNLGRVIEQAQTCVQYLREIGQSWQCATDISRILNNLLLERLKPRLEQRFAVGTRLLGLNVPQDESSSAERKRRRSSSSKNEPTFRRSSSSINKTDGSRSDMFPLPVPNNQSTSLQTLEAPQILPTSIEPQPSLIHVPRYVSTQPIFEQIPHPFVNPYTYRGPTPLSMCNPYAVIPQEPVDADFEMMTSSGYLATIGGQPLSSMPYVPPFSMVGANEAHLVMDISSAISSPLMTGSLMDISASTHTFTELDLDRNSNEDVENLAAFKQVLLRYFG